jgi:hypothetical protein
MVNWGNEASAAKKDDVELKAEPILKCRTVAFDGLFTETLRYLTRRKRDLGRDRVPLTMSEVVMKGFGNEISGGEDLDRLVLDSLQYLDENGYQRSMQQREFHNQFRRACMKQFYGKKYEQCKERILQDNDWACIKQTVLISTPRRFGKTMSTAEYWTVMTMVMKKYRTCLYSTGNLTATQMLTQCRIFYFALPMNTQYEVLRDNEKELRFSPKTDQADVRWIKSFTSNEMISIPNHFDSPFLVFAQGLVFLSFPKHKCFLSKHS